MIFPRAVAGGVITVFIDGLFVEAEQEDPRSIAKGSTTAVFGSDCELAETTPKIQ